MSRTRKPAARNGIEKSPTGIFGLDQITEGGLPKGRPTLICGTAGCGKTILAMEFLVRGATEFGEPGVFMAFEETGKELSKNVASMGFDLPALVAGKKLVLDHVHIDRNEIAESGEYDLEGLFIRLGSAIDAIGARRVVLDTIESLFSSFTDTNILRAELRRLFRWLKEKGVSAVITAETGDGTITRNGIEEYVADCVILLDHRVEDQSSIRRLRVLKYRGTMHGTNEYPFLIGQTGLSVLPLSSLKLEHTAPTERISTGVPRLDTMLGGKGFYRGTSILLSGTAGTGKSSLAAHFVQAACKRGERALYIASEQSPDEVIRNMRSIGVDLEPWIKRGLLQFYAARPGTFGLEKHLVTIHDLTMEFDPKVVVIDPITNFGSVGTDSEVKSMVTRLIDMFKASQITALFTSLTSGDSDPELSEVGVSSQMDAWLLLRNLESNGERNRGLYVLKSRGMAHSNQIREFLLTDQGVQLRDVYVGPSGLLTGSAREAQEAKERAEATERQQQTLRKAFELKQKRQQLEAEVARMRADFALLERSSLRDARTKESKEKQIAVDRVEMGRIRKADAVSAHGNGRA
ncbi:MAG TPA: circadian clock protein KaiC [Candidatus Dormibacteraeota bacterium]|nr:circadian clock protein KaiC [Candidatus Dormibacteraeota bacterium]